MARLCALALAAGIEVEYVHALIRLRGLENPAGGAALDAWPFAVKIRALGEFTVLVSVQLTSEADAEALGHIVDTFRVITE